jgi:hypothetical protein
MFPIVIALTGRIVTGNSENARAICHNDVFALAGNSEAGFFKCPNRVEVLDAGQLGHR